MEKLNEKKLDEAFRKLEVMGEVGAKLAEEDDIDPFIVMSTMTGISMASDMIKNVNTFSEAICELFNKYEEYAKFKGMDIPEWEDKDSLGFGVDEWVTFFKPKKGDKK